jgi:hypothetical protein
MKHLVVIVLIGVSLSAQAIRPEREYQFTPDRFGLSYTEYQVTTPDNYNINIWEYKLPNDVNATRTIILVGTDAGNMGYFIWQAKAFLSKGLRVLAFDYRGFGKSSDFSINSDYLFYPEFGVDLDSVIKVVRNKYPTDKIGLYALSMGTYVSLLRKEKVDFLVAEGFYHDPQKVVERIKVNKSRSVLLPAGANSIMKVRPRTPTLIFCASNDQVTSTADAREFAKRNTAILIEFEGDHLMGMNVFRRTDYGDEYAEKVIEFLERIGV